MPIRCAAEADWEAILAIYNEAIPEGNATADTEPVSLSDRLDWFREHAADTYPIYVEEENDKGPIRAWCSLSPYRCGRAALRRTAEISYYVGAEHRGQGIASSLVQHAMADAQRLGFRTFFGILLDTNEPSIGLLKKLGFETWGHLPGVADFGDRECGHLYLGKRIA